MNEGIKSIYTKKETSKLKIALTQQTGQQTGFWILEDFYAEPRTFATYEKVNRRRAFNFQKKA